MARRKDGRPRTSNPELHQAMMELRRSNAASPHVPKPKRDPKYKRGVIEDDE